MDKAPLLQEDKSFPLYLKSLLLSLVLTVVSVVLLRLNGITHHPYEEQGFTPYMMALACLLPAFALFLDRRMLLARFRAIDAEDRLVVSLIILGQVLWFYDTRAMAFALALFLLIKLWQGLRFLQDQGRQSLSQILVQLKQRAKELPVYAYCLIGIVFLMLLGMMWQSDPEHFPNISDRYILLSLVLLSLLFGQLRKATIYAYARLLLPIVLSLFAVYFLYACAVHLLYVDEKELFNWLFHPLTRQYASIVPGDYPGKFLEPFYAYAECLSMPHPSFGLISLLPPFLITCFPQAFGTVSERRISYEHWAFACFCLVFFFLVHMRYSLYFSVLMFILLAVKYFDFDLICILRQRPYIPVLIFLAFVLVLYLGRAFFFDPFRWRIYHVILDSIKLHPWIGHGTGAEVTLFSVRPWTIAHTHNLLLSMLVNFGVLGLLWTLVFYVSLLWNYIKGTKVMRFYILAFLPMTIIDMPFVLSFEIYMFALGFYIITAWEWQEKSNN